MMDINKKRLGQNIKRLRKQAKLTQEQFAEKFGIKGKNVGSYEEGRASPKLDIAREIISYFGLSLDQLLDEDLALLSDKEIEDLKNFADSPSFPITLNGIGNIPLVDRKVAAGYTGGFDDEFSSNELPTLQIPFLRGTNYRAFEIDGDSMYDMVSSGDIVVADKVENVSHIKNGDPCIVCTHDEGLVFKYVYPKKGINGQAYYTLSSKNRLFEPYDIAANEVISLWKASLVIKRINGQYINQTF